jgi:hypothetical protein
MSESILNDQDVTFGRAALEDLIGSRQRQRPSASRAQPLSGVLEIVLLQC